MSCHFIRDYLRNQYIRKKEYIVCEREVAYIILSAR